MQFETVNKGARENLGYSVEELRKLTPLDLKPTMSADEFERLLAPLRDGRKARIQFDTEHRCARMVRPIPFRSIWAYRR